VSPILSEEDTSASLQKSTQQVRTPTLTSEKAREVPLPEEKEDDYIELTKELEIDYSK